MPSTARVLIVLVCVLSMALPAEPWSVRRKNVLFLIADDMSTHLGCYKEENAPSIVHPEMHTPNLDKLASKSLLLLRAHAQQALCGPSRTSFLTGRRPDTTKIYDLLRNWRDYTANFSSMPQFFKERGYHSIGAGKVFHPGPSDNNDPYSWTQTFYEAPNYEFWEMDNRFSWFAVPPSMRAEMPLPDEQVTEYAIKQLHQLAPAARTGEQPFFMAVGLWKPHYPLVFPEEYLNHYPMQDIQLPPNSYAPVNMPNIAWWDYPELRSYTDIEALNVTGQINSTLPDDVVLNQRRAYYASVSYADHLFGRIIQTLDDLGLAQDTIVSFVSDHGTHRGEHGEWDKETNFELATHVPMMVRVPGQTDQGIQTTALVEMVDLFPTLVEAAGYPSLPLCPEVAPEQHKLCTEGISLLPLIEDSERPWKKAVFSQFPRPEFINFTSMGYSVLVDDARYTEWVAVNQTTQRPIWDMVNATELYDHTVDPQENWNRAEDPDYATMRQTLHTILRAGWREAQPGVDTGDYFYF